LAIPARAVIGGPLLAGFYFFASNTKLCELFGGAGSPARGRAGRLKGKRRAACASAFANAGKMRSAPQNLFFNTAFA
jgi:hypothetical protein